MKKRLVMLAVPLAAGAMVLAGCSSSGGSSSSSSGGGKPSFTLAYQGPLSGDNSALGINEKWGVQLAIQQANARGDLPVTLKYEESDDQGDPAVGPAAGQKLIGNDNVIAVVGPAFSGVTKAVGASYAAANLVLMSPSATNPTLTSLGFTSFFRVVPPDTAQGQGAADYITKALKATNVYSVDDKSDYGTGLSGVLESQLKADGATVTHAGIAPTKDYSGLAGTIAGAKPAAVYYSGYYSDFALFLKALKAAGYNGPVGSGDGSNDNKLIDLAGADANGAFLTCPCSDPNVDPAQAQFVAAYTALAKQPPGTYSAEAYDAANAIISVIKGEGTNPNRANTLAGVRTVSNQGLTKLIKFASNGEVAGKIIFVYQVKDGKRVVLGTVDKLTAGS